LFFCVVKEKILNKEKKHLRNAGGRYADQAGHREGPRRQKEEEAEKVLEDQEVGRTRCKWGGIRLDFVEAVTYVVKYRLPGFRETGKRNPGGSEGTE